MQWSHLLSFFHSLSKPDRFVARAADTCYMPIIELLEAHPHARVTISLDATLTERLHAVGQDRVIEALGRLAERGQVEFAATGYGAVILPNLPKDEARRAVRRNTEANRRYLGEAYDPVGLFPAEMSYAPEVAPVAAELGCRWIAVDEMSHSGKAGAQRSDVLYALREHPEVTVFFRDRSISTGIIYGSFESADSLMEALRQRGGEGRYLFTATEADVFGTRRAGPRAFLADVMEKRALQMVTLSALAQAALEREPVSPVPASWSSWDTLAF